MKASILIGLVLSVLIMAAGFVGGYYFSSHHTTNETPVEPSTVTAEPRQPNHTTYDISPPSRGAMLETFTVTITPDDNAASVTANALEAQHVKTGQQVLLYDANNTLLDILGTVVKIAENPDGTITADLFLGGDDTVSSASVAKGEIIIDRSPDAQRLPRSALVHDVNSGEAYLWEVNKTPEGTSKAFYKRTNLVKETSDFVIISTPASHSNVFILAPDAALKDGDIINTQETLYSASALTEDQIIAAKIESRHPTPVGPDPYTGPDFPSTCSITQDGGIVPGSMSLPR